MWGLVKFRHLEKSREMSVLNLSLPNYTKLGNSNFIPGCSKLHVDETFLTVTVLTGVSRDP